MNNLKHFHHFLMNETIELDRLNNENPNAESGNQTWNSEHSNHIFHIEVRFYRLVIYPQYEVFLLTFSDGGFIWCSWGAVSKNKIYLNEFEEGKVYDWLVQKLNEEKVKAHLET